VQFNQSRQVLINIASKRTTALNNNAVFMADNIDDHFSGGAIWKQNTQLRAKKQTI
jgi:hypothetical protein